MKRGGKSALGLRHTRSARSSSASLPVPSTFSRAPKILILSVSIAVKFMSLTGILFEHGLVRTHKY